MNAKNARLILGNLMAVIACATPAFAGSGEIVDGKINLSVVFTYDESDLDAWRPVFEEASRLLYNATNGQMQIGRVRVESCGVDLDDADIWVLDSNGGAFANVLGLGAEGHLYISQTHKSTADPALGQFGIVHELGHYAFGLYDEYKAAPPEDGKTAEQFLPVPNQFCTTDDDPIACIMDGGTTIPINNRRTEFCTHTVGDLTTRHNEGQEVDGILYINAQQTLNAESCWETISRLVGLAEPVAVDTADPAGLEPIDWEVVSDLNRVVVAIDRSASMFDHPELIELAKSAGDLFVDLLHARKTIMIGGAPVTLPGDNLAVVPFAADPEIAFPMQEVDSEATRDSALAVVARISPVIHYDNLSTDIGGGLRASLQQILDQGDIAACGESIVLLSDGRQNEGTDPADLIPELQARGARVYAIGLGADPDVDRLTALAEQTGVKYYQAASMEDLPGVMTLVSNDVRAAGLRADIDGSIEGQESIQSILIESFAEEVTFVLQWGEGALDMSLTSPTGDPIDVESAEGRDDVEAERNDLMLYIRVTHPEIGEWTARIIQGQPGDTTQFNLSVFDETRSVSVTASTDQAVYDYPDPVHLRVDVIAGVPVAGAEVTATVDRPNADSVTIPVYDDGAAIHGDQWANDGVYSTIFGGGLDGGGYTSDGTYTFHVRVVNETGTGPDPNLPFVEDGAGGPESIEPFIREVTTTIRLQGVSEAIQGDLDFEPRVLHVGQSSGRVTCYIELPAPHIPQEVDRSTVLLNGVVSPLNSPASYGDHDDDGIPDLMLKFTRSDVLAILPAGAEVEVRLTGSLTTGEFFVARDTIAVIDPYQGEGAVVIDPDTTVVGESVHISWPGMGDLPVHYAGLITVDGGETWSVIFDAPAGSEVTDWTVTGPTAGQAQILVQAECAEGVVRQMLSGPFAIEAPATAQDDAPLRTRFLGARPNPAGAEVTLSYALARALDVRLEVYDVRGRLVRTLATGLQEAGAHVIRWDGTDAQGRRATSGVYMYRFRAGSEAASGRILLLR